MRGHYFERAVLCRVANRKSQKLFPFVKMIEIREGVFIHLKVKWLKFFPLKVGPF